MQHLSDFETKAIIAIENFLRFVPKPRACGHDDSDGGEDPEIWGKIAIRKHFAVVREKLAQGPISDLDEFLIFRMFKWCLTTEEVNELGDLIADGVALRKRKLPLTKMLGDVVIPKVLKSDEGCDALALASDVQTKATPATTTTSPHKQTPSERRTADILKLFSQNAFVSSKSNDGRGAQGSYSERTQRRMWGLRSLPAVRLERSHNDSFRTNIYRC